VLIKLEHGPDAAGVTNVHKAGWGCNVSKYYDLHSTVGDRPLVYIYRVLRSRHDELEVGDVVKEVTEVD